ncbi:MAG: hypothetical protein AB7H43_04165 [Acidimicrobiia bacterium]
MAIDGERLQLCRAVPDLPAELWGWLTGPSFVRPDVVADVRARLLAGERRTPLELAEAVIRPRSVALGPKLLVP